MASVLVAMAPSASALSDDPREQDRIRIEPREDLLELAWSDTEERLQGSIRPAVPREGEPLQVVIQVGSFQGEDFAGPVTLTLREAGSNHGKTVTVPRGERHWEATFVPETTGIHRLDVSFRTTRYKALHTAFRVEDSRVPRLLAWGVLGLFAVGLIGYTVRNMLKGEQPRERSTALSDGPVPAEAAAPVPEGEAPSTPPPPAPISPPAAEPEAAQAGATAADPSPAPAAEPEDKPTLPQ
ncbi:MAG TPA: hypothetical protein VEY88_17510 [Archangium sp.]|nr:hypothetical protein [Archangium sp.]